MPDGYDNPGPAAQMTTGGNVGQTRTTVAPPAQRGRGRGRGRGRRRRMRMRRAGQGVTTRDAADALAQTGGNMRPAPRRPMPVQRRPPPGQAQTGRMPPPGQARMPPQAMTGRWQPPERGTRTTVPPPSRRPGQPPPAQAGPSASFQRGRMPLRRGQTRPQAMTQGPMMTGGNMPPPRR